jgi:pyrimidine deaminase RibD-like protein
MDDEKYMKMAIKAARKSRVEPSYRVHPRVGAVVVTADEEVVSAFRGELGDGDHVEYTALEKKMPNAKLVGATVYSTLEPCTTRNHPKVPCAVRLTERRVARVWIGMLDPNPRI